MIKDAHYPFKLKPNETLLAQEKRILDKTVLETVASAIKDSKQIITTIVKEVKTPPPLPYNLTTLQADMSKRYKYSAIKTQDITQSLRDTYKATTYNRTDSQYLKEEHHLAAPEVLTLSMENCGLSWSLDFTLKSKAFNEENVSAHHAIIPQEVSIDVSQMSEGERNVYLSIVKRYALQFLPPEIADVSTSTFDTEFGQFIHKTKRVNNTGWKDYTDDSSEKKRAGHKRRG